MRIRVKPSVMRGPTKPSVRWDDDYDDECGCDSPLWVEVGKGVLVTAAGALLAPSVQRVGEWIADRLFGGESSDGALEMDEDDFKSAVREAIRAELGGDDDGG